MLKFVNFGVAGRATEIQPRRALRTQLELKGHRFRTWCDTAVVLRRFLEWDTQCFERMNGMFAVPLCFLLPDQ